MTIKNLKKYQAIKVDWLDSVHEMGWKKASYYSDSDDDSVNIKTRGFYIGSTKETVCIALSVQQTKDEDRYVDGVVQIPKKSIIKISKG